MRRYDLAVIFTTPLFRFLSPPFPCFLFLFVGVTSIVTSTSHFLLDSLMVFYIAGDYYVRYKITGGGGGG